jgi:AcrR family transcriptional regulator
MTAAARIREQQRAVTKSAILDAAVRLYADAGTDGASLRTVAEAAGLTHPLIARYFGSKRGLVAEVGDHVTACAAAGIEAVDSRDAQGFTELLQSARRNRSTTKLLIRSALGDLSPEGFPDCLGGLWPRSSFSGGRMADRRAQLCQYGASSLLLGWLTFDEFLVSAVRLDATSERRRDQSIASTAALVWELAATSEPALQPKRLTVRTPSTGPSAREERSVQDTLLNSAIELFAAHGPASVPIRDIARHAGMNHGLFHRHFGTKDNLVAEAIESGVSSLLPGALAADGFDIDDVVHVTHHASTAPKLIARTLLDNMDIRTVRRRYPVMHSLLAALQQLPADSRPSELADPRLAAAAAGALVGGSAIWGPSLRQVIGLDDDVGVETAVADLSRHLLGFPNPALRPTNEAT